MIGPGFLIQSINGKNHHLSGINPGCPCFRHMKVLKIIEPAVLTGNKKHRPPLMAIYLALHIPSQNRTVHFVIIHFHRYPPFCYSSPYISVGIKKGSCRSQHASQWVPPGTILLVTITSLLSKIFASLESCPATFGRCLPSSEP